MSGFSGSRGTLEKSRTEGDMTGGVPSHLLAWHGVTEWNSRL